MFWEAVARINLLSLFWRRDLTTIEDAMVVFELTISLETVTHGWCNGIFWSDFSTVGLTSLIFENMFWKARAILMKAHVGFLKANTRAVSSALAIFPHETLGL